MKRAPRLTFDFESQSECELKKAGAYVYSKHPSTRPTCMAYKVKDESKTYLFKTKEINTPWKKLPIEFRKRWKSYITRRLLFTAHNAFFELCIYENILVERYGWPSIPFELYRCTAAKAAACALPRNLAGVGEALKLAIQKDPRGHQAMMATCKPTRSYNAWKKACEEVKAGKRVGPKKIKLSTQAAPPMFLTYEAAPQVWETLYTYCEIDVKAEEAVDDVLPDLIASEQKIWFLNQKINWRGFRVDVPLIKKISAIMEAESKVKLKELDALTMGFVTKAGARKSILEFLEAEGVILPDIRAKTVDDLLSSGKLSDEGRKLLEIRKALSKTSTRKYQAFLHRAWRDDRVRDILMYHGASTGRDAGTGINPQNFPRGLLPVDKRRPYAAVDNVVAYDAETLRLFYGESLGILFSAILRNMIIPSEGCELFVSDLAKIEVAVLWWLADNKPGLKILKAGLDPYKYQAAANTGMKYEMISDEGDHRQLGKAQVLGCGFGMGAPKFQTTAYDMYRLKLTMAESKHAVQSYREANKAVPEMWKNVERAAVYAIENPGERVTIHKCKFYLKNRFLCIKLPSGRVLRYREPQITWKESPYGYGPQKTIEFWAVNSKTKKWNLERTWGGTLTENIVQAVARDVMYENAPHMEAKGYRILTLVHDEVVGEKEKKKGTEKEFSKLLAARPPWGDENLPLEAKGYCAMRYRK